MRKNLLCFIMIATMLLVLSSCSGNGLIQLVVDGEVLETVEELDYDRNSEVLMFLSRKGIDMSDASPLVLHTMTNMDLETFFEVIDCDDEDDFDDELNEINGEIAAAVLLGSDAEVLSNYVEACIRDSILDYCICIADINAECIADIAQVYADICYLNSGISMDNTSYIGKVDNKNGKAVKYNGKEDDLNNFINNYSNDEARDAYYCVLFDDNSVDNVYWSKNKTKVEDDIKPEHYSWNLQSVENGSVLVGTYPNGGTYYNLKQSAILKNSGGFVSLGAKVDSADNDIYDTQSYWAVYYILEKVDNNLNDATKNLDPNSKYASEVTISAANANAKQVHTALSSSLTQLGIDNFNFGTNDGASLTFDGINNGVISINWDNVTNRPDDKRVDLISYLGENYNGYAYVEFNPLTYSVKLALWSNNPIPDEYRHLLTNEEQESLINKGVIIGCYPLNVNNEDSNTAKKESKITVSSANANAKQVHTALSSSLTQLGIDNFNFGTNDNASLTFDGINNGVISINWDNVTNRPDDKRVDLISYLGENYDGYAYVEFNPLTYSVKLALWSENPIPDEYRHQFTEEEQEALKNKGIIIGCYPLSY